MILYPHAHPPTHTQNAPPLYRLGDANVGKTSLVVRVKEGTFSVAATQPTIGCSFCHHVAALPEGAGTLPLALWDTAGQEKYRSFTRQYFRGAVGAVVVYDVTSTASLDGARKWLVELGTTLPATPAPALVLCGAKCDLQRAVPLDDACALATAFGATHIACSAKDGTNVERVFGDIASKVHERGLMYPAEQTSRISISLAPAAAAATIGTVPLRRSQQGCC